MIEDFNKRQRVIDLDEETKDEILKPVIKTDSIFDTPQYKKVMAACKERSEIPTMAWTPDDSEESIEEVLKIELGDSLEKLEDGVAVGLIDFTKDSEYRKLYE